MSAATTLNPARPASERFLSERATATLPAVGFGPPPAAPVPGTIALHGGVPGAAALPTAELSRAFAEELADPAAPSLRYSVPLGIPELRSWIAAEEGVAADRVVVTNGGLHALALVFDAIVNPGDVVAVENPTYPLVLTLLRQRGAQIVSVATGPAGIDLADLEDQLRGGLRPKLLYTIPDFHNPTGASQSVGTRRRLVELAEQYDLLLLSDNPYRHLRFDGTDRPDLDLGSDHVVHANTFSKTLGPGLRLGWVAGPDWLVPPLLDARRDSDQFTSLLVQRAVLRFLTTPGAYATSLATTRRVLAERHTALLDAVAEHLGGLVELPAVDGGIFSWGRLTDPALDLDSVLDRSRANAVDFPLGRYFSPRGVQDHRRAFRWGFSDLTPEQLREAVERFARALTS